MTNPVNNLINFEEMAYSYRINNQGAICDLDGDRLINRIPVKLTILNNGLSRYRQLVDNQQRSIMPYDLYVNLTLHQSSNDQPIPFTRDSEDAIAFSNESVHLNINNVRVAQTTDVYFKAQILPNYGHIQANQVPPQNWWPRVIQSHTFTLIMH